MRPSDFPCNVQAVACGGDGGNHQSYCPPLVIKGYAVPCIEAAGNQPIEMTTASLTDLMKERLENRVETRQGLQFLNAQKLGDHEAEIEKIKSVFLSILRNIKKDIDSDEQLGEIVTAATLYIMQEAVEAMSRSRFPWTM